LLGLGDFWLSCTDDEKVLWFLLDADELVWAARLVIFKKAE
jgi:hypothetical protein